MRDAGDRTTRAARCSRSSAHGENGFLVASVDEAVAAVEAAAALDGEAVRESVVRRFDVERMVDDYLELYRRVLSR